MLIQQQALVKNDAAAISKAKTDLSYTRITSPISGVTGIRGIDMGNVIHSTDTKALVTVTQIEPITVVFTLPQQNLGPIQARMTTTKLPADAYDQDNEVLLSHGELTVVDNQVDQKTGSVRMKATFPNADHKLWPGAFVNVHLETDIRKNVITVPSVAIQHGLDGVFVFLIKPDNTVEHRPVTVGSIAGDLTLIESGLNDGDRVVTDGYARLTEGMKVRINGAPRDKTPAPGV
jgi:membrane fusion protein, multidrug efflux system